MNDVDSKKLEIRNLRARIDELETDSEVLREAGLQAADDLLKAETKKKEQDREIDYQRRHRKWALKQCRTRQRYFCFYKDDAVRFHSDRADKAEAVLRELTPGGSEFQTVDECRKWIEQRLAGRARAEARVTEVEDLRYQSFKETREHCNKWQQDRMEIMKNLPGYEYKNRVDDPEWELAKKILFCRLLGSHES